MLRVVYTLVYALAFICFLPVMAYRAIFQGKYRKNFGLKLFPPAIKKGEKPVILFHGVSVGEVLAIQPLYELFEKEGKYDFVITCGTETGMEQAKKHFPKAFAHLFLPFDFPFSMRRFLFYMQPEKVILSEGDYWFNFLSEAKRGGAKVYVVNGKLSKTSQKRLQRFSFFSKRLFSLIDGFFLQSEGFLKRFESLGIPSFKLAAVGSLKLDRAPPPENEEEVRRSFKLEGEGPVLVFGSTHPREEDLALDIFEKLKPSFPHLKLVIVPRHPERFDEVAALINKKGLSFARFSQLKEAPILLVDAMGQLMHLYAAADIAIVCGSFFPGVGGHNIIEPCFFGTPTLYGPVLHSQPALFELSQEFQAGLCVEKDALASTLSELLASPEKRERLSQNGRLLIEKCAGAAKRTFLGLQ